MPIVRLHFQTIPRPTGTADVGRHRRAIERSWAYRGMFPSRRVRMTPTLAECKAHVSPHIARGVFVAATIRLLKPQLDPLPRRGRSALECLLPTARGLGAFSCPRGQSGRSAPFRHAAPETCNGSGSIAEAHADQHQADDVERPIGLEARRPCKAAEQANSNEHRQDGADVGIVTHLGFSDIVRG